MAFLLTALLCVFVTIDTNRELKLQLQGLIIACDAGFRRTANNTNGAKD